MAEETLSEIQAELITIRKLLLVGLMRSGASQAEIAGALGVNQSSISRMLISAGSVKRGSNARR